MKIGVVCYPTYGGSGIVATELGMEMAQKGHEVHFMSYKQPARLDILQKNIFFHQVEVESYPLFDYQPYSLALSTLMVEITKTHQLDVVHVHYAIPHAYAAYFAKQILAEQGIKLPVITTLHGTDITLVGQHPSYKSGVEFSINHSDFVTAVSESLKKDTYKVFNIQKEIHVIHNFIENQLYGQLKPCPKCNFVEKDEKLLIHISNFREVKNVPDVVRVFHKVQQQIKSKLLLLGTGPDMEKVRELVHELGIQEKVIFLGKTRQINEILCMGDLFLLPSSQESFGLAALEAMASGLPVISSNAGGISEVNTQGVTGFLSNIHNVEEMAQNAIHILENPETLEQFKKAALQRSLDFSVEKILPLYEAVYKKAYQLKHS